MGSFDDLVKAYGSGVVFTAFDIETTGLNPQADRVVEIGAVKFDRRGLIARFSTLINPGVPMPAEAEKVNHISDDMLRGKPSLDEALPDFLRFIKGGALAAHNAPFDCGFINESLKARWELAAKPAVKARPRPGELLEGLLAGPEAGGGTGQNAVWVPPFPGLPNPTVDTLALSREAFPGLKSYGLQNLAAALGIEAGDAHRAEDDAKLCMDILLRCLERAAQQT